MNKFENANEPRPDDAFLELIFGEQILLWGIRVWVNNHLTNSNENNLIHLAYSKAGIPYAHTALDAMMTIITTSGFGAMEIRCPSCEKISADEMRLMSAIAALQHRSGSHDGNIFLECWARPTTLRILRPATQMLAKALTKRGLLIRQRPWTLRPFLLNRQITRVELQSTTIH